MSYSFQSFSVGQVLTAAQMDQVEANIRDHQHGVSSVSAAGQIFDDSLLITGSADATKKIRFEVDGLTTATTRTITVPDANVTLLIEAATQAVMETGTDITRGTTPGRQQFHPSAAKGWCQASTAGSSASAYNVASVTDSGTGDGAVNWTVALSSTSYCAVVTPQFDFTGAAAGTLVGTVPPSGFGTTSTRFIVARVSDGAFTDPNYTMLVTYGDQA